MHILQALHDFKAFDAIEEQHRKELIQLYQAEENFDRKHFPGHFTASAWAVDTEKRSCFLILHRKLNKWLQAGGHAEGDRALDQVALKELEEETGLTGSRISLFDLDIHAIPARKAEPCHWHYDLRFWVEVEHPEAVQTNHETQGGSWFAWDEVVSDPRFNPSITRMSKKSLLRAG
ncbi:MAG: NUDIX hydrolase [Cyclobacteriaceae bacterium]|nr:NUDIX hydrolase [Cyclobacteriaceae bacterium]MCH8517693.1 NUDIX hydrolase [Cyclobacteriaceae bacterium]